MDWLTIVLGMVTIASFAIQLTDIFPNYAIYKKNIAIFAAGTFIGSVFSNLSNVIITITLPDNPLALALLVIIFISIAVIFMFTLISMLSNSPSRRSDAGGAAVISCMLSFIVIPLCGISYYAMTKKEEVKQGIHDQEYIQLLKYNESAHNYDRAIILSEEFKRVLIDKGEKTENINNYINNLKKAKNNIEPNNQQNR